jgi:hypothetical protein
MLFAQAVQGEMGSETSEGNIASIIGLMGALQESGRMEEPIEEDRPSYTAEIAQLSETEEQLGELEQQLVDFQSIHPQVLVSPFSK